MGPCSRQIGPRALRTAPRTYPVARRDLGSGAGPVWACAVRSPALPRLPAPVCALRHAEGVKEACRPAAVVARSWESLAGASVGLRRWVWATYLAVSWPRLSTPTRLAEPRGSERPGSRSPAGVRPASIPSPGGHRSIVGRCRLMPPPLALGVWSNGRSRGVLGSGHRASSTMCTEVSARAVGVGRMFHVELSAVPRMFLTRPFGQVRRPPSCLDDVTTGPMTACPASFERTRALLDGSGGRGPAGVERALEALGGSACRGWSGVGRRCSTWNAWIAPSQAPCTPCRSTPGRVAARWHGAAAVLITATPAS